jgi:GSH-dependent disulfide-bond oxidoreductase
LTKGEQRKPESLALNPYARVPVLIDRDLTLWESHAILVYLGEKAGKMWPASAAGRADALRWLFSVRARHTAADLAGNRIAVKVVGGKPHEDAIARGEKALPDVIRIVEAKLAKSKWLLGDDFTLVDCAYAPILNITEKTGFSCEEFPKFRAYMDAIRSRPDWQETVLSGL